MPGRIKRNKTAATPPKKKKNDTGINRQNRMPIGSQPEWKRQGQQPPPQQPSAPQRLLLGRDSETISASGSGSSGASLLSEHRQPSGQLTREEIEAIEAIIKEKLEGISTDSGFEIIELVEALVNSGLKKNTETVEAAIEYVKDDIQAYVREKHKTNKTNMTNMTNMTNNEHQNNLKTMETNIIGKIKGYDFHAAANKPESPRGPFCCGTGGSIKKKHKRKTAKKTKCKKRRKWSKKYKDSISCKKPKGFSQRQHCLAKSKKRNQ